MSRKQAKAELKQILTQKTVSISRLKRVLEVIDYEQLERSFIETARSVKRQREVLRNKEERIKNQRKMISDLLSKLEELRE